ncbi:FAD-dependent oxidoreductase [Winogradskyella sp. DF17]|uniref:FAD-dependent oxidoreductase n=1 Tax=Winogradskyella pelagia TaxID=2819984 RepID=A0ABS3SZ03_9FLAO|nr:FAD-dependent oxidoreductase [Winogradskyella sp. DF17]MBO3115710.1 FAD-dependent oxidoreductase [Winogradskyella sp. DF17]
MKKNVIIIGGGIIGLCSAYYLNKTGYTVSIIDKSNLDAGASYVNAGYLSPSHIIPLAAPGVMKKGLKWMFNSSSPLYIKPRINSSFLKWGLAFNKSCTPLHVAKAAPIIRDITLLSQQLYEDIIATEKLNSHYEKKGLIMLCQTEKTLEEEHNMLELAKQLGLEAKFMTPDDIKTIEPNVVINTIGGIFYKCDHHSTPFEFMSGMKTLLSNSGVDFYSNEHVIDIAFKNNEITGIKTNKNHYQADEIVLAAGSWSSILSRKIGLNLLLEAGKGYRIDTTKHLSVSIPAILAESKVAVTPMNGFTRFAGTMEIAGINHNINKVRVDAIADAVERYYPNIELTSEDRANSACGLRPVSPDGLPYIGKSSKCKNLTIATGHAMMGWSMGTATGLLVNEIISKKKTSLPLEAFHPERRF